MTPNIIIHQKYQLFIITSSEFKEINAFNINVFYYTLKPNIFYGIFFGKLLKKIEIYKTIRPFSVFFQDLSYLGIFQGNLVILVD